MSSKIEDVFDLPPMNEEKVDEPIKQEDTGLDLTQLQQPKLMLHYQWLETWRHWTQIWTSMLTKPCMHSRT